MMPYAAMTGKDVWEDQNADAEYSLKIFYMFSKSYRALVARESPDGRFSQKIEERQVSDLPENEVLIRVKYSGLNYKDALSASGNRGVTKKYPFQPGIDASGIVEDSGNALFRPGDEVLVTGYDLGMNTDGGFGEYIRVPAEWIVPRPQGLTLKACMIYGTAGFTAALGIDKMLRMGQTPGDGEVLVTGASGGVGSLAVSIFSRLGFSVIAATGKHEHSDHLMRIGANRVIPREAVDDDSGRPLLRTRWAGAYDTVGGNILATVIKACKVHGSVACCGNVRSYNLETTIFPFILNGVNLLGVNSATCSMEHRRKLWDLLEDKWKPAHLDAMAKTIELDDLPSYIPRILEGKTTGRIVVNTG